MIPVLPSDLYVEEMTKTWVINGIWYTVNVQSSKTNNKRDVEVSYIIAGQSVGEKEFPELITFKLVSEYADLINISEYDDVAEYLEGGYWCMEIDGIVYESDISWGGEPPDWATHFSEYSK